MRATSSRTAAHASASVEVPAAAARIPSARSSRTRRENTPDFTALRFSGCAERNVAGFPSGFMSLSGVSTEAHAHRYRRWRGAITPGKGGMPISVPYALRVARGRERIRDGHGQRLRHRRRLLHPSPRSASETSLGKTTKTLTCRYFNRCSCRNDLIVVSQAAKLRRTALRTLRQEQVALPLGRSHVKGNNRRSYRRRAAVCRAR